MVKQPAKKYTFYRFRFWIGYAMIGLALIGLLTLAATSVPGGLNAGEQASALKSASLNLKHPSSLLVTDMPYHALQKLSIALLGLSNLSVKLPSTLLAFITSVGLVLLLRRWFPSRVSVITGGIAVTSAPFIFLATQGTPAIMTVFWSVIILLLASWSVRGGKSAYITIPLLGIAAGLSLYTPLSVFTLLALIIGGLLHPHVRYVIRKKMSKPLLTLAVLLGILTLLPLAYMLYRTPVLMSGLVLASGTLSFDLLENLRLVALQFVDITGRSTQSTGLLAPFFTLAVGLMVLVGAVRLLRQKHSAQNYILMSWLLLLVPVVLLNPRQPELLFIPLILLSGVGVAYIMQYWYQLFPNNPYARTFGLLPLTVLMGGLMLTGSLRYFYTFHYNPVLANNVSRDLELIADEYEKLSDTSQPLLAVAAHEHPLYQLYVDTNDLHLKVTTAVNATQLPGHENADIIATRESDIVKVGTAPERIVASKDRSDTSDRLYIYKNTDK